MAEGALPGLMPRAKPKTPALVPITFLLVSLTSGLAAATECPPVVRFAVLGDRTGHEVPGVFGQVLDEVQRLRPDLVVTIGDMIEGYTADPVVLRREWQEYLELASRLDVPLYHTPGNGDISFDEMAPAYEDFIGKATYSFDHLGLHFVVLDTSRWETIEQLPKAQLEWLEDDLGRNRGARQTFVFMHRPYWYRTLASDRPDALHDILRRHGVRAVFTGHLHAYFTAEFDGILYTSVGSSGGGMPPHHRGAGFTFLWVTVDSEGVHMAPVKAGAVLPWAQRTVAEYRRAESIHNRALSFVAPMEVGSDLKVAESEVTLRVENEAAEECRDVVEWEVPEGWRVEPLSQPLVVPAGGSGTATFRVGSTGKLYPVPRASMRLPSVSGETAQVTKALDVARRLESVRAEPRPTIDGDLGDPVWHHPERLLLGPDGGRSPIDPVEVYFANDDEDLFFAVRCRDERMDLLRAEMKERDDRVYGEDSFGLNLYPASGEGGGVQIYVNPLGTVFDERVFREPDGFWTNDPSWNGDYEVRTARGEDFWTAEVRIPLQQLGADAARGRVLRLNFRRKQSRYESYGAWQLPWSYNPASAGKLILR